jgi:membrane-associated protease RseP (regulator of RpoE activity)
MHPYREPASSELSFEECPGVTACWCCERRAARTRVRRRRWWGILAIALMVAPVTWVPLVFAYTRVAAPMIAAIERLDAATIEATRLSRAAAVPPPQPSAPQPPSGAPAASAWLGILKLSDTAFLVDRQVIDEALETQASVMRAARIVPDVEDGRVAGIRLFGVHPDSLLGLLGFENGDRLDSVNGFDLSTPARALEAYARLRSADHLSVVLNRRGSKVRIRYDIV